MYLIEVGLAGKCSRCVFQFDRQEVSKSGLFQIRSSNRYFQGTHIRNSNRMDICCPFLVVIVSNLRWLFSTSINSSFS